jgi:cell division protein FtsQ
MIARRRRSAAPPAPPSPRRRRVPIGTMLRRIALWTLLVLLTIGGYGAVTLGRTPTGQAILAVIADRALATSAALGFVVANIEVEGRETTDVRTIMAALNAQRGTPILGVSPSRAKQQLERLPWVRSATIERRLPGTLHVRLLERHPLAVWQHAGKHELIDRDGQVIAVGDLSRFARLPTVVGDDAARHAAKLIDMLAREPELAARVNAAVRVDERRWNLRIDNAIDVLLPEDKPGEAWTRLAALERSSSLLKRDILTVDLRLPDRLVVRGAGPPPPDPPAKAARPSGKSA